jgi:hypothetical protein
VLLTLPAAWQLEWCGDARDRELDRSVWFISTRLPFSTSGVAKANAPVWGVACQTISRNALASGSIRQGHCHVCHSSNRRLAMASALRLMGSLTATRDYGAAGAGFHFTVSDLCST